MMDATDQAGYAGIALVAYHFGGVLGAGIALFVSSLIIALIVASGRE
jgi:hypothetical protein